LQPLPYAHPERLLKIEAPGPGRMRGEVSLPNAKAWQQRASDFRSSAFSDSVITTLDLPHHTDWISNDQVSTNLLATLGVQPRFGRNFKASDAGAPVAILTDTLWKSEFHRRRGILEPVS
ncbi:MAG: hypothetical protein ACRD45_11795, partial [Bryobacteraceae bacterium]